MRICRARPELDFLVSDRLIAKAIVRSCSFVEHPTRPTFVHRRNKGAVKPVVEADVATNVVVRVPLPSRAGLNANGRVNRRHRNTHQEAKRVCGNIVRLNWMALRRLGDLDKPDAPSKALANTP